MNNPILAASGRKERPWWYVQPGLLTAFFALIAMWIVVWNVMGAYLTDARVLSSFAQCAHLFARAGDLAAGLIVNR
jgi:hypothetical protein